MSPNQSHTRSLLSIGVLVALLAYLSTQLQANLFGSVPLGQPINGQQTSWPPKSGELMPNLKLEDHHGQQVELASLRGKVIILEYVGMSCPACQSFSGASKSGGFGRVQPQPGLLSVATYLKQYGKGANIRDNRIAFVQLLLYDLANRTPDANAVSNWASHFRFDKHRNHFVLRGTNGLRQAVRPAQIPGFVLIDKNFVVRSMTDKSTPLGLYDELLPMVPKLLAQ